MSDASSFPVAGDSCHGKRVVSRRGRSAFVACYCGNRVGSNRAGRLSGYTGSSLIIPFAPGGGVDLFGRTVARMLNSEKIVTQPIQVLNKPGAGGATGIAEMVHVRKGNPYSLLGIAIHVFVTPMMPGTPYSYKHLTPIAKIFTEHQMMVVRRNRRSKASRRSKAPCARTSAASGSAARPSAPGPHDGRQVRPGRRRRSVQDHLYCLFRRRVERSDPRRSCRCRAGRP